MLALTNYHQYRKEIESGNILVCEKVDQILKLNEKYFDGSDSRYYFEKIFVRLLSIRV